MSCSPYQSTFITIIEARNNTMGNITYLQIKEVEFLLDPVYAEGLYNSCRDVSSYGDPTIGSLYPTYELFFNWLFGNQNAAFKINFIFDTELGYTNDIVPCADICPCYSCRDSCDPSSTSENQDTTISGL
eukprot:gene12064-14115_t